MDLFNVSHLSSEVASKRVLRGVNLQVNAHEVHAIMGPNGSGKSSFAMAVMGHPSYVPVSARHTSIILDGVQLFNADVSTRARAGLYVAWQTPMTIPGVSVFSLCKSSYEAMGHTIDSLVSFKQRLEALAVEVGLTKEHVVRHVNEGFSGGEKKRLELLQLLLLQPKVAILDEIDSGLDIDALKMVGNVVKRMSVTGTAFVLITHYKRLLEYVKPDHVHVLVGGKIVKSGDAALVLHIEQYGYQKIDTQ